jgi:putative two-component system response regulator
LKNDYTVLTARDGREAIDLALNEKPDLILMDILMPNMDGYTACSVIKSNPETRSITLIMITAIDHKLNRSFSEKIGADGYITKPFDCQVLKDKIDLILDHISTI